MRTFEVIIGYAYVYYWDDQEQYHNIELRKGDKVSHDSDYLLTTYANKFREVAYDPSALVLGSFQPPPPPPPPWDGAGNGSGQPTAISSNDLAVGGSDYNRTINFKQATKNLLGKAETAVQTSDKGIADGVASLGADGKVPAEQLPEIPGQGISDAPSDNKLYGRKNASWEEVTGVSGGDSPLTANDINSILTTTGFPSVTV